MLRRSTLFIADHKKNNYAPKEHPVSISIQSRLVFF
jgi:hypothetical protein